MIRPSRKHPPTKLTSSLQLQLQALSQEAGILSEDLPLLFANELSDLCGHWKLDLTTDLQPLQKQIRKKLLEHLGQMSLYYGSSSNKARQREDFKLAFRFGFNIGLHPVQEVLGKEARQALIKTLDPQRKGISSRTAQRYLQIAYVEIEKQMIDAGCRSQVPVSVFKGDASPVDGDVVDGDQSDGESEPSIPTPDIPFWRRRKTLLLGSIAFVVVMTAATTPFVVNALKPADKITPESILRATILSTGTDSAYGGIFPAQLSAKATNYVDKLGSLPKAADYEQVFQNELSDGAYAAGGIRVNIALQVLVDGEISLYDIKPVNVKREPVPLDTVILLSLGHGPGANIEVSLDQAVPVAMDVGSGKPTRFGAAEVMGLSKNNKGSIDAAFTTQTVAETFDIAISYEYQGASYSQVLHRTPDGQPFRAAALMCDSKLQTPVSEVSTAELERLRALRYRKVVGLDPTIDAAGNYTAKTIDPNVFATQCY